MATRPHQSQQAILDEARHLIARVRARKKQIQKSEEKAKIKVASDTVIAGWEGTLRDATQSVGRHAAESVSVGAATQAEEGARGLLHDLIEGVRGDVELRCSESVAEAFGIGTEAPANSTPRLLAIAEAQVQAFGDPRFQSPAIDAGVTPQRIDQVAEAAQALADADTSQNHGLSTRKSVTQRKNALIHRVRANNGRIKRIVRHVFRNQPDVLREFQSTLPRHTPRPRATPGTPPRTP